MLGVYEHGYALLAHVIFDIVHGWMMHLCYNSVHQFGMLERHWILQSTCIKYMFLDYVGFFVTLEELRL